MVAHHAGLRQKEIISPTPPKLKRMLDDYQLVPVALNYAEGMSHVWEPEHDDLFAKKWERKLVHLGDVESR